MEQTSGVRGGLYAVSEWISRLALANLSWAAFNLPVGLLLLSLLYSSGLQEAGYLLPPLIVLLPVLFFPATAALFAQAREWVRKDEEKGSRRSFWSYYKENYKTSAAAGTFLTILWGLLVADLYYFSAVNQLLMNVFLVLGILLFVYTINCFSVMVHYDMKARHVMKQALLITITSPVLFVAVAVSAGFMLMVSLYIFPLIIPIFTGSIIAFLSFSAFYRVYRKLNTENGPGC
ncbi:YesL family protein [Halobacillus kuroshimensis]|uniref:YesL family protein n=1 Tax=Halobacillus kuroshimensis TaxID=302481 RepID=UPI000403FE18|nr:DUF624 domain-containing protein [Halobacillus kuroshimensis]